MQLNFIHRVSIAGSKPMLELGGAIFVLLFGLAGISFGLWMIFSPDRYWGMWKRYLEKYEYADSDDPRFARVEAIRRHTNTAFPKRKARLIGGGIIFVILVIESLLWRVIFHGPFGG
jgi:hypothetical protein